MMLVQCGNPNCPSHRRAQTKCPATVLTTASSGPRPGGDLEGLQSCSFNARRLIPGEAAGLSGILCARPVSSLADEPFAEDDGELGLGPNH